MKYTSILLWLSGVQALAVKPQKRDDEIAFRILTTYATEDVIPSTETAEISTTPVPTGTVFLLPSLSDVQPQTTGVIMSDEGTTSKPPLITDRIPSPTSLLEPIEPTLRAEREVPESDVLERQAQDIFAPIATSGPPSSITRRSDHPQPRTGVIKSGPIQTNKFYSNFFLGSQTAPTYTYPYAVSWAKGTGPAASWGMAISHIEPHQWWYGPVQDNGAVQYYINPVGIQSMILSAKELGNNTVLNIDQMAPFSARVTLKKNASSAPLIYFPLVQGMPFVTGRFTGGTPQIQSGVYFRSMTRVATNPKANVRKFNFLLEDGTTWIVYAYRTSGVHLDLEVINNGLVRAKKPFTGVVQVAKKAGADKALDEGAGIFPTSVALTGSTSGGTATYGFRFSRSGHKTGSLYMFALPHHVASFDDGTRSRIQTLRLQTPVKGVATLVKGVRWTMVESGTAPGLDLAPWDGSKGGPLKSLSNAAKNAIGPIALSEVSQDMIAQSNLDSMYFSGKALLKFAQIVYVINDMLGNSALAEAGLLKLKEAYEIFATNQQQFPLVYESAWGGVVSSASYTTGDSHADFGNTYYNDHHFHYGYHVLAAAYIGHLDPVWAEEKKDYVNTLIRDFANPSSKDTWFPQHRNFDWYHGHSWAHGLFESLDGKNQESSSEDMMAMYGVKMWGLVIGDSNMVARASLQMAVMKRSLNNYYYLTKDNINHPFNFIGNKVAGVVHENKADHSTFFSADIEAIQGIHMIPVHGPTGFSKPKSFIREEWNTYFSNGRVDEFDNAWKSIIYANSALIAPKRAWNYFNQEDFKPHWIDGGASRAWYMAYAAALGGA